MPELVEQMYCSQQIVIPPKYPYILKKYCKAAIKTQPYDLLRWSFEYFRALAEHRPPPVKLRLEYPIYNSEGGLTRGCHKVLAAQLGGMSEVPLTILKRAWQGFCLDPMELRRILCLCEVYNRADSVPFLHFIAVAGGLLTKCLTHTMILLCESLTKEPDGGSAAISLKAFLTMYRFLAAIDASSDVKYYNGYREGQAPEEAEEEEAEAAAATSEVKKDKSQMGEEEDEFWEHSSDLVRLTLIDDKVDLGARISLKAAMPLIGEIERTPSVLRATQIERENYMAERKGKPKPNEEVERRLREMSLIQIGEKEDEEKKETTEETKKSEILKQEIAPEEAKNEIVIIVFDEDGNEIPLEIYGEPELEEELSTHGDLSTIDGAKSTMEGAKSTIEGAKSTIDGAKSTVAAVKPADGAKSTTQAVKGDPSKAQDQSLKADAVSKMQGQTVSKTQPSQTKSVTLTASQPLEMIKSEDLILDPVAKVIYQARKAKEERILDLEETFADLAVLVDKFNSANYDLGMVAGRQMSTTSGEFIVQTIEKEILAYIDDQIAILPDPDLKKKKAKPEEVEMIRGLLQTFLDENMDIIVPEVEEVEEEEQPIPEIIVVYAVPGIGPVVASDIVTDFEDYAREVCKVQSDVIMPRNLRHYLCPPLELYEEFKFGSKREEAPVGGVITD